MSFFTESRLIWFLKWVVIPVVVIDLLSVAYLVIWSAIR